MGHKTAVFVRANPHDVNQAIPRALEAARGQFDRLVVLCWNHKGLAANDAQVLDGVEIRRFGFVMNGPGVRAVIGIVLYQLWALRQILVLRPDVVQGFDVYSMAPSALGRLLTGCRCVYDMRDPFALSYDFSPLVRRAAYCADWILMGLSTAFIVPDESRIPYLGRWGDLRPIAVIKNTCHDRLKQVESMSLEDVPPKDGRVRIVYLGYLAYSRGANDLLTLSRDPQVATEVWLAGSCSPPELEAQFKASPNARWWGKCSWMKSLVLTRSSDLTSILYDPKVAVNRIAAPNKMYESLMLGTPILVAEGMLQAELVRREGLGYVVPYGDVQALKKVVADLSDPDKAKRMRQRCREYFLKHSSLAGELDKYRAFYRRLSGPHRHRSKASLKSA